MRRWFRFPAAQVPLVLLVSGLLLVASPASAAPSTGATPFAHSTGVGIHNTYEQSAYPWLADALDSGTALIELDVWANSLLRRWNVSHDNPLGNANNCAPQLRSGTRNQDFGVCLDDLRLWSDAHPGHRPIIVKLELKSGYNSRAGLSPAALDAVIASRLGSRVYRPADLLRGTYSTLDAAAVADAWPTRDGLAGRFLFELIPGSVEESNPFDTLWTDLEYGRYIRDLAAAGTIGSAQIFPAVHRAATGDPRTRYSETSVRPWFIAFDGDAAAYVSSVDTSWYDARHYLLIMTDAHAVSPALDQFQPALADAQARVAQLAAAHASIASTDWYGVPAVVPTVLTRG